MAAPNRILARLGNEEHLADDGEARLKALGVYPTGGQMSGIHKRLAFGSQGRGNAPLPFAPQRSALSTSENYLPSNNNAPILNPWETRTGMQPRKRQHSGYIGLGQIGRNVFGDVEEMVTGLSTLGAMAANALATSIMHPSTLRDAPRKLAEFAKLSGEAMWADLKEYRYDFWGKLQRDPLFTLLDAGDLLSLGTLHGATAAAKLAKSPIRAARGMKAAERIGRTESMIAKALLQANEYSTAGRLVRKGLGGGQKQLGRAADAARDSARARSIAGGQGSADLLPTKLESFVMNFDEVVGTEGFARQFKVMIGDPTKSFRRKLNIGAYKAAYASLKALKLEEKGLFLDFIEGTFLFDEAIEARIKEGVSDEFREAVRIWRDDVTENNEHILVTGLAIQTKAQLARASWLPMMRAATEEVAFRPIAVREIVHMSAKEFRDGFKAKKGETPRFEWAKGQRSVIDNSTGEQLSSASVTRHGEKADLSGVTDREGLLHARLQRNHLEDGHFLMDESLAGQTPKLPSQVGILEDGSPRVVQGEGGALNPKALSRQDYVTDRQRAQFMSDLGIVSTDMHNPVQYIDMINNRARLVRDVEETQSRIAQLTEESFRYQDELDEIGRARDAEVGPPSPIPDEAELPELQALLGKQRARLELEEIAGTEVGRLADDETIRSTRREDAEYRRSDLQDFRNVEQATNELTSYRALAMDDVLDTDAARGEWQAPRKSTVDFGEGPETMTEMAFQPYQHVSIEEMEFARDITFLEGELSAVRRELARISDTPSGIDIIAPKPKFIDPTHFSVVFEHQLSQRRIFKNTMAFVTRKKFQDAMEVIGPDVNISDVGPSGKVRQLGQLSDRSGYGLNRPGRVGKLTIIDPADGLVKTIDLDHPMAKKALALEEAAVSIMRDRHEFLRAIDMARAITEEFAYELIPAVTGATPRKAMITLAADKSSILAEFDTTADLLDHVLADGITHNGKRFDVSAWAPEYYENVKGAQHAISESVAGYINQGLDVPEAFRNAFDDIGNDLPSRERLIAATKRGTPIRVVPRAIANAIKHDAGDVGRHELNIANLTKATFDDMGDMFRTLWLHTPRFVFNTIATNTATAIVAGIGIRDFIDAMKSKNKEILGPITELQASQSLAERGGELILSTKGGENPITNAWNIFRQEGVIAGLGHSLTGQPVAEIAEKIDNLYRRAAFIKSVRATGKHTLTENVDALRGVLDNTSDERLAQVFSQLDNKDILRDWTRMRQALIDGELMDDMTTRLHLAVSEPRTFIEGVKFTNYWFFNYFEMSQFERNYVRRAMPFWNWIKNIHKLAERVPVDHPFRANMVAHLGAVAADVNDQEDLPEFLKGTVEASFLDLQRIRGGGTNPLETLIFKESSIGGMVGAAMQASHPVIQYLMMAGTASKVFPVGREFSDENMVRSFHRIMRINPVTQEVVGEEDGVFPGPAEYFLTLIPQTKALWDGARALADGATAVFPNRKAWEKKVNAVLGHPPQAVRTRSGVLVYPPSPYKSLLQFFGLSTVALQSADQDRMNQKVMERALEIWDRTQAQERVRKSTQGSLGKFRDITTGKWH